jgi:hypothetical protein
VKSTLKTKTNVLVSNNFLDAPLPWGGGIQITPDLQNIYILSFSNFSTPNHGLGLKSTLKTKTNVLVSNNFLDVNLIDSHPNNTLPQKRAVFMVRNFSYHPKPLP